LPIKRRLPRKRRAVGHNPDIITTLRLLYRSKANFATDCQTAQKKTEKSSYVYDVYLTNWP
ncbi:MAG: hypothetical protein ACLSDO_11495, partial [Anaerotruncus colihominis]